eukprot:CCRYP_009831-RA/>CCRYP_009831-RA protein AED:0.17 eAED:0.19 QI:0/0/0/1/0/0/2/0/493
MSALMVALELVRSYFDDLLCITEANLEDHHDKLKMVLTRLREVGLQINAQKLSFCAIETEYLGYTLTRTGIRPQQKMVQAILAILLPKNIKDLRKFLGMVQYCRYLSARHSKVLAPLTSPVEECGHTKVARANKTKKLPWYWDTVHQKAFYDVKTTIAKDVVLAYPDYSREFEIYTDDLSKRLGSVITQRKRPLAFFSRKLSTVQQKYSLTKLELRSIVETLKEFKGMLWGQRLKLYTDHKNLIQDALGLTSDRVYLWRLLLEEFGPEIVYIKGTHNTVADTISRLDIGHIPNKCKKRVQLTYQEEMNPVFVNCSKEDVIYPLTVQEIAQAQKLDASLKTLKDQYSTQVVKSIELLCKDGKVIIPKELQHCTVSWYHHYLQHPGHTRLEETLCAVIYWKGMRNTIRQYVKNCHACQVNKRHKYKYGKLPTKFAITNPWEVLCVELIGPYTIKGKDGTVIDFMCLTMIDPASSWFEILELPVITEANIPLDTKG